MNKIISKIDNFEISSFMLHILAMLFMLCDHIWATIYSSEILTCIGRLTFPIFAFMCVEGYFYTKNFKKYILRIFLFACISEIPFNLMYAGNIIYPFHQNVLWKFLIGLLFIKLMEKIIEKDFNLFIFWILILGIFLLTYILGNLLMIDYYGYGIWMMFIFFFFRERTLRNFLLQLFWLGLINFRYLGSYCYGVDLFGFEFQIAQQGLAILSLIPIWLYKGKQGYHNKWIQYSFYIFYPIHMLILALL